MHRILTSRELFVLLKQPLNLPDDCSRVEIVLDSCKPVVVRTEQQVKADGGDGLVTALSDYWLTPRTPSLDGTLPL